MTNHYHLFVETPDATLSKGMRKLNGVYTQSSNRRHGRRGHLFQGRYKARLVDSDAYPLELSRYIALNPVRAGMVHFATIGKTVRKGGWRSSAARRAAPTVPSAGKSQYGNASFPALVDDSVGL